MFLREKCFHEKVIQGGAGPEPESSTTDLPDGWATTYWAHILGKWYGELILCNEVESALRQSVVHPGQDTILLLHQKIRG